MWFDVQKALAEIEGGDVPPSVTGKPDPLEPISTNSTNSTASGQRCADSEARQPPEGAAANLQAVQSGTGAGSPSGTNRNKKGLGDDLKTYADHLQRHGPTTYGAAASALGWGATRAWQAEAKLREVGLESVDLGELAGLIRGR